MNNLVIISRHKAVTDSLTVANKFKKRHDRVLRKIEGLIKEDEGTHLNFLSCACRSQVKRPWNGKSNSTTPLKRWKRP